FGGDQGANARHLRLERHAYPRRERAPGRARRRPKRRDPKSRPHVALAFARSPGRARHGTCPDDRVDGSVSRAGLREPSACRRKSRPWILSLANNPIRVFGEGVLWGRPSERRAFVPSMTPHPSIYYASFYGFIFN